MAQTRVPSNAATAVEVFYRAWSNLEADQSNGRQDNGNAVCAAQEEVTRHVTLGLHPNIVGLVAAARECRKGRERLQQRRGEAQRRVATAARGCIMPSTPAQGEHGYWLWGAFAVLEEVPLVRLLGVQSYLEEM